MSKLKPNKQIESPLNGRQPSCKCQNIWHRSSFVIRHSSSSLAGTHPVLAVASGANHLRVSQKFKHSQEGTHFDSGVCVGVLKTLCKHLNVCTMYAFQFFSLVFWFHDSVKVVSAKFWAKVLFLAKPQHKKDKPRRRDGNIFRARFSYTLLLLCTHSSSFWPHLASLSHEKNNKFEWTHAARWKNQNYGHADVISQQFYSLSSFFCFFSFSLSVLHSLFATERGNTWTHERTVRLQMCGS